MGSTGGPSDSSLTNNKPIQFIARSGVPMETLVGRTTVKLGFLPASKMELGVNINLTLTRLQKM